MRKENVKIQIDLVYQYLKKKCLYSNGFGLPIFFFNVYIYFNGLGLSVFKENVYIIKEMAYQYLKKIYIL